MIESLKDKDFLIPTFVAMESINMPMLVADNNLLIVWANSFSTEHCQHLSLSDSVRNLLSGYDINKIIEHIKNTKKSITFNSGLTLVSTTVTISPILNSPPEHLFFSIHLGFCEQDILATNPQGATRVLYQFSAATRIPLTSVFSSISIAEEALKHNDYEHFSQMIEQIKQSCFYMLKGSSSITEFSRYSNGMAYINLHDTDMFDFIANLASAASAELDIKGIELTLDVPTSKLIMACDTNIYSIVFASLLSNACAFVDKDKIGGSSILVRVRKNGHFLETSIQDNGKGIPEDVYAHIFEPYYSYGRDSEQYVSTGLGLTLAKMMLEFHYGSLAISSTENEGTTALFTIPCDLLGGNSPSVLFDNDSSTILRNKFSSFNIFLADAVLPDGI